MTAPIVPLALGRVARFAGWHAQSKAMGVVSIRVARSEQSDGRGQHPGGTLRAKRWAWSVSRWYAQSKAMGVVREAMNKVPSLPKPPSRTHTPWNSEIFVSSAHGSSDEQCQPRSAIRAMHRASRCSCQPASRRSDAEPADFERRFLR